MTASKTQQMQKKRIPSPRDVFFNPIVFAETFLKIQDKRKRLVPLRYNRTQLAYLENRTRQDLILKARQFGISTVIQAEYFRACTTGTATTLTLAHDMETTQKLRRMVARFYNNLPKGFRPARKYDNSRVATYPDFDSEAMIATAGSIHTGRGGTYSHFHGSEVAFWVDAEALVAGAMQGGEPIVVLESTPNGAQGYFYELCMEALDGNSDYKLHFYPWWFDGAYRLKLDEGEVIEYTDEEAALVEKYSLTLEQIKWRRKKQRELKSLFPQEYPEDPKACFLLSGKGYFGDISHCYKAPWNAIRQPGHRYVAGLDFAQSNDFLVLSVIDATAKVQVDRLRINRLSWEEMRRQVREKCKRWEIKTLNAEANSMGRTNIEAMTNEFKADDVKTKIIPFWTDNTSKATAAGDLHEALHHGGLLLLDDPDQKREMQAFTATQNPKTLVWSLSAPNNEHDDFVIANMLGWDAALYASSGTYGIA
jgi:hypothetical protein